MGGSTFEDAPPSFMEMMPEGTWLQELDEILGERCCELRKLSHKKRKNGPGSLYQQQYLVRGKFLRKMKKAITTMMEMQRHLIKSHGGGRML